MGYTHYFKKQRTPSSAEWQIIEHIANWVAAKAPLHSTSAGGFMEKEPLRGALVTYIEKQNPITGKYSDLVTDLDHETINIVQRMEGYPAIVLDGKGELGHEPFLLTSAPHEEDDKFGACMWFCKTARKPYDLLVCATLILVECYAPGMLKIHSDGDPEDWGPALEFARMYDKKAMLPVGVDPSQSFEPVPCNPSVFSSEPPSMFIGSDTGPGLYF